MAITLSASGQGSGGSSASVTSLSVTAGQLITSVACIAYTSSQTPAAGDLTKETGTATIGTPTLDKYLVINTGNAPYYLGLAFYSVLVTGSGSLAVKITPTGTSAAMSHHLSVWNGTFDSSRVESAPTIASSATDDQTSHPSGSASSAGAALFLAGLSVFKTTNAAVTQDATYTLLTEYEDGTTKVCGGASYRIVSGATTDDSTYTSSGPNYGWESGLVVYKEAAGSATGTGAISLGPVAVSGTGERVVPGSGAITLGPVALDGTGAIGGEETGSGDIPLGALTVSGSGAVARDATGAITLGVITVDGTAEREVVSAGGAVELTLGAITVDGTGGINSEITGTGAIALGPVSVAGTAEREQTGTGAVTLGPVAVAGVAERVATGTGAIELGPVTVDGTGTDAPAGTEIGSGEITLGAITVSAAANIASNSQSSGGWWPDWEYLRKQRRKRQREIEEAKSEAQRIQDELDRQIALEQRRIEAEQAEKADLERLQMLADRYAAQKMPELPKPVRVAILNAKDARTKNSLEQMRRAIEQANEQELLTAHLQQFLML